MSSSFFYDLLYQEVIQYFNKVSLLNKYQLPVYPLSTAVYPGEIYS